MNRLDFMIEAERRRLRAYRDSVKGYEKLAMHTVERINQIKRQQHLEALADAEDAALAEEINSEDRQTEQHGRGPYD